MQQKSINKAKKLIWSDLQSLVGDPEFWESTIELDNWDETVFEKALSDIFDQLEKKV